MTGHRRSRQHAPRRGAARSRLAIIAALFVAMCATAGWTALELARAAEAAAAPAAPPEPVLTDEDREHWAYQPLAANDVPEVTDARWSAHPIDRFVRAELEKQGLEPLPRASRATLLRRLSFDLTGLPPTPAEIAAFLVDESPDAYERQVDRLLASRAYGERYAQHWLDLARFAETDGFEHDLVRPNAWRYREWVIDALNADMPYDRFVQLQLAGDLIEPDDPDAAIATGFLLSGPDMPDLNLVEERRHVVLNEMTSTVGAVLLGLQFGCASCHDHKYDPISQYDFYRLRAFFESADLFVDHPVPTAAQLQEREAAEAALPPEARNLRRRHAELEQLGAARFREKNPDEPPTRAQRLAELSRGDREELERLDKQIANLPKLPELPRGRVMRAAAPRESYLYLRGDFRNQGPAVTCGFPQVLDAEPRDEPPPADEARADLAEWITSPDNALAARVMANRLWQWHFGVGLVETSSDFGIMGAAPTHPELLDWLASRLVAEGFSLKRMHRLIVTSETYKLASAAFDPGWTEAELAQARTAWAAASEADPENDYLWRRRRVRLEGEAIRDAMLAVGERLSPRRGGQGVRPPLPPEVTITLLKNQWQVTKNEEDHRRRSVYLFVRRNLRYPLFDVFDRPDTNASCARRHESTTATQSLVLLNSQFSLEAARHLAGAVRAAHPGDQEAQVREAYLRVFGRAPREDELAQARAFLAAQSRQLRDAGRGGDSLAIPAAADEPKQKQPADSPRTTANAGDTPDAAGVPDRGDVPDGTATPDRADDAFAAAAWVDLCLALFNANEFVYVD